MADISSYSTSSPVTGEDKWIGTSSSGSTKNFKASDVAAYINGTAPGNVRTITTTGQYLVLTDSNIVMSPTLAANLYVPINSSVPFPIGTRITVMNKSLVTVTLGSPAGATLSGAALTILTNTAKTLVKIDTDTWFLY